MLLSFSICLIGEVHAATLPPISAFGNLPVASDPSLSPDGKYFAVIQTVQGLPAALIYPVGRTTPSILKSDQWIVVGLRWVKPDRLLLTLKANVTARGDYQLRTWVRYATVKPDGSGFQILMSNDPLFRFNIRTGSVTQYGPESGAVSFWQSRIGDFSDDAEQLVATSPAFHADRVKCPILLLHGADDTTVRIEQSRIMEDALRKAGKPVQFVTLQGDDHYFTLPETRIRMLTELEAFLKKNIGN